MRNHCLSALCAAAILIGSPAGAQTQTKAPAPAAKPSVEPDTANVTIFAKRKPKKSAPQQTVINTQKASSCGFAKVFTDVLKTGDPFQIQAFLNDDATSQAYFKDMGIENPNALMDAIEGTDPLKVGGDYSDTSPYGSAAVGDTGTASKVTVADEPFVAGTCTAADAAAAAARSDIARHDQSMSQAFEAMDAKNYLAAIAFFKTGYSKVGYPVAAYYLGKMYLAGLGTKRDTQQAIVWFKRVAEAPFDARDQQGFDAVAPYYKNARVDSDITLANIYMTGFDVPKSPKDARKWYAEAEKYGYIPADFMLGQMAEAGYGDAKSVPQAVTYYQKSGEYGFAPAQYRLGQMYYSGDGVLQDKTLAGAWLLKAAKNGYPDALYAVARMYELGEGGASVDLPKALVYYKEAAVKGQIDAQLTLGTYLYTGEGGAPKDLDTARKLFQSAAEQGDPQAMFNLGVMMVNGEGGPKDLVRAYCWFYVADKGGIPQAGPAMRELSGKMTADERAQADALLKPKAAS